MQIEHLLVEIPKLDPDAAVVESAKQWWCWGQLDALSGAIIAKIDETGSPQGSRIGLLLRNRAAPLAALMACVISRRCAVAFNPVIPVAKLAADVEQQCPALLIGMADDLPGELRAIAEAMGLPVLELSDAIGTTPRWANEFRTPPSGSLDRLAPDTLVEMLSSGTTGTPKRIPLARDNFNRSLQSAQALDGKGASGGLRLRSGTRLQTAPLTHMSGLATVLMTLAEGRKLALMEKFSVEDWADAVERTQPRLVNLPPAALRMILDANIPKERLVSLAGIRSGTAPVDPSLIDAFAERYNLPVLVQYGATEFSGSVAGWDIAAFRELYASKRGSVGKMQPGIEARIVDGDTGEVLPPRHDGILELRGNQIGDAAQWVRTTDRASLDEDNYLWINGRADGAINRGGFKVHPDDVVAALQKHPSVREAVVVGVKDARLGEVPAAAIVLARGEPAPTREEFKTFLSDLLSPYQIPVKYLIVEDLPRTPSLKPALPAVREMFVQGVA